MLEELGSRRIATSATGQVASRHDYMPFGEEVLAGTGGRTTAQGYGGNDGVRNKFTGYERDVESGLDYAQAKYFSSKHGRFTSVDPLTASGNIKAPQSLNRYSYANNSPYKFTDSLGLSPQCQGPGGGQGSTLASCDGAGSGTGDDCPAGKTCTIPCSGGAPGCQTDLSAVIATVELKISELMPTAEEVNAVIRELEALEAASEAEIATTITPRALLTIPKFLGAGAVIALTPLPGPGGCQAETGNELCGYPESQAQPQIQPTTTTEEDPPPRGSIFQRNGAFRQSLAELTRQAEEAERNPNYGYGISVFLKPRANNPNSRVADVGVAQAAFQIRQTGSIANRNTVFFPKPLDQATVNRFYNIFRRP